MSTAYPDSLSVEQAHSSLELEETPLRRTIRRVLSAEGATLVHLSVVLADHETVRRLNRSYLDHDYNTDVLSFSLRSQTETAPSPVEEPSANEMTVEGEVYVDLDTAAERHEEFDTTFERETYRYVIHGVLHLVGYDDATEAGQETMRRKEDQYLDAVEAIPDS
ncbi:MAG: rRNA maturation RNase YbeY [Salinibacter sp.]